MQRKCNPSDAIDVKVHEVYVSGDFFEKDDKVYCTELTIGNRVNFGELLEEGNKQYEREFEEWRKKLLIED